MCSPGGCEPTLPAEGSPAGVGDVSVVAFSYEIYTIPSQNNGVLGATLTANYV